MKKIETIFDSEYAKSAYMYKRGFKRAAFKEFKKHPSVRKELKFPQFCFCIEILIKASTK